MRKFIQPGSTPSTAPVSGSQAPHLGTIPSDPSHPTSRQIAEAGKAAVENLSRERWAYFASLVLLVAICTTFGVLIWRIASAFR